MNYKIIAIFTLLLLALETLTGIPFGIWLTKNELIFNSPLYHLGQYMAGFVVNFIVFYFLYMQKINKPVQHAIIIGMLCWVIGASIVYMWTGVKYPPLLVVVDAILTVLAISLALYIAKIRGKLGASA